MVFRTRHEVPTAPPEDDEWSLSSSVFEREGLEGTVANKTMAGADVLRESVLGVAMAAEDAASFGKASVLGMALGMHDAATYATYVAGTLPNHMRSLPKQINVGSFKSWIKEEDKTDSVEVDFGGDHDTVVASRYVDPAGMFEISTRSVESEVTVPYVSKRRFFVRAASKRPDKRRSIFSLRRKKPTKEKLPEKSISDQLWESLAGSIDPM